MAFNHKWYNIDIFDDQQILTWNQHGIGLSISFKKIYSNEQLFLKSNKQLFYPYRIILKPIYYGINSEQQGNGTSYILFQMYSFQANNKFRKNLPFFKILKKNMNLQYCNSFKLILTWLKTLMQSIYPFPSFTQAFYDDLIVKEPLFTQQQKNNAKDLLYDLDQLYNQIFSSKICIQRQISVIKKTNDVNIDYLKNLLLFKKMINENFQEIIYGQHNVLYNYTHSFIFSHVKSLFDIIPIHDNFVQMHSSDFNQLIKKWLCIKLGIVDLVKLILLYGSFNQVVIYSRWFRLCKDCSVKFIGNEIIRSDSDVDESIFLDNDVAFFHSNRQITLD